jgi:hypothetical protein
VCGVLLVLLIVCSLTASVATRYCSNDSAPSKTIVVHKDSSSEPTRQRITTSTANWLPVVVQWALERPATDHPHLTSSQPVLVSNFLAQSLYNRPPPSL